MSSGTASLARTNEQLSAQALNVRTAHPVLASVFAGITPFAAFSRSGEVTGLAKLGRLVRRILQRSNADLRAARQRQPQAIGRIADRLGVHSILRRCTAIPWACRSDEQMALGRDYFRHSRRC